MPIFVVHRHQARKLHFDLLLQYGSSLMSWAVPKQPPLRPGIKRLAIKVENHALSYAKFEGKIKEGYGKGTVKIWDKGTFKTIRKTAGIIIDFRGKKLKGRYALLPFKRAGKNKWLFFKEKAKPI